MKLIDEKGRLFGKVNLLDLLVILLLAAAVAALGWKLVGKKAAQTVSDTGCRVRFTVVCEDVQRDICSFAQTQTGNSLVNNGKLLSASVTEISSEPNAANPAHQDLFLTVEADAAFSANVYKLGTQEVRVGYEYIVKTSEFELTGLICALEVTDG